MLRFFYYIYFTKFKNATVDSYHKRLSVRAINVIMTAYYTLTSGFTQKRRLKKNTEPKVIVSLTSYPDRIGKIWLTIETLLDQTKKPDKIILWLYKGEFSGEQDLPKRLTALKERGLEIKFCDKNLKPHKKYYYTMLNYPNSIVITGDDDMLFHPRLLENLLHCHEKFPHAICCSISREIKIEDQTIRPYREWKPLHKNTEPVHKNHLMGGGGPLFPANSLDPEVFNEKAIEKLALRTDDLWLKVMSLKNRTKIASVAGEYQRYFIPLIHKNDNPLMNENLENNENDKVIEAILEHYDLSNLISKTIKG